MNLPCLGIDIAKVKFNVCLLQPNGKLKHKVFLNTEAGFAQLHQWLEQQQSVKQVHACLEATGTYGEALSYYLHDRGYTVRICWQSNRLLLLQNTTSYLCEIRSSSHCLW